MIVIEIKGGLGNQLYQFMAAYYAMKQRNKNESIYFVDKFIIELDVAEQRKFQLQYFNIPFEIYQGDTRHCTQIEYTEFTDITKIDFSSFGENILLSNYFIVHQHINLYREEYINLIKVNIELLKPPPEYFDILEKIKNSNAVIVHVRHGDRVEKNFFTHHGIVKKEYYLEQIEQINKEIKDCHFFFFTNTITFVKDEYSDIPNSTIVHVEHEHADLLEFELMKYGSHFILSNSTFSQLAATLSYTSAPNKKVYIPRVHERKNPIAKDSSTFLEKDWIYVGDDDVFIDEEELEYLVKKYYPYKFFKSKYNELLKEHHAYQNILEDKWYLFGKMSKSKKILFIIKMMIKKLLFIQ